jgi:hypothetical protein
MWHLGAIEAMAQSSDFENSGVNPAVAIWAFEKLWIFLD